MEHPPQGFSEQTGNRAVYVESSSAQRNGFVEGGCIRTLVLEMSLATEKRKILLIDDSEITLAMEKAVLEARGYEVVATSTLLEFEKTLQSWRPDLILT